MTTLGPKLIEKLTEFLTRKGRVRQPGYRLRLGARDLKSGCWLSVVVSSMDLVLGNFGVVEKPIRLLFPASRIPPSCEEIPLTGKRVIHINKRWMGTTEKSVSG